MLAAIMMMGSLVSSIAFAPAAPALASGQDCQNGQVWDDSQQMCVDPTPEGGDQMDATETPMPTETPTVTPTPGPASLNAYAVACPAGYDFNGQGANPANDCTTPLNGVQMAYTAQGQPGQQQSTSGGGVAAFSNLTPGSFTLAETAPSGTKATSWMCQSQMQGPTNGSGTNLSGQISGDESLNCVFYNIPADTTPTTTVTVTPTGTAEGSDNGLTIIIHKFECPAGYDVSGQDANPQTDCPTQEQGVQFNISGSSTGYTSQSDTGDSVPGAVTFGGLEPDTYTITETPPMGTTSAFVTQCVQTTTSNQSIPHYPTVTNWSIQYQFDQNDVQLECYWYNVPSDEWTATPTMTPTATSTAPATLLIYKWLCPAGYDPNGSGANPSSDCATPQDGVQFNITGNTNGYTSQTNTGDSIPGAVMFGSIEPDTYHVVETLPAGTASAFITDCQVTGEGDVTLPSISPVVSATGETDIELSGGVTVACSWYNIPWSDAIADRDPHDDGHADAHGHQHGAFDAPHLQVHVPGELRSECLRRQSGGRLRDANGWRAVQHHRQHQWLHQPDEHGRQHPWCRDVRRHRT
ncbi:MAG: hypothetical protein QM753_10780 [Thermomicrobiales bacterium]